MFTLTGCGDGSVSSLAGSTSDASEVETTLADGLPDEPAAVLCGNGIIDGDEVCDGDDLVGQTCEDPYGFDDGELGCNDDCTLDYSSCNNFLCGNGTTEPDEDCDGTVGEATCVDVPGADFDNGILFCTAECRYDIRLCGRCGDGAVSSGEQCDTAGTLPSSCLSQGYQTGSLQCGADCRFDTSLCSTCGNDVREGVEDCDGLDFVETSCTDVPGGGFDSGSLECNHECEFGTATCGTCGNDQRDGEELCDGSSFGAESCLTQGFDNGWLTCSDDCAVSTTEHCGGCGDAVIDSGESCDGVMLGGATCASLGLGGGELACGANCGFNFLGCEPQGIHFANDGFYDGVYLTPEVLPCDNILPTGTALNLPEFAVAQVPIGFSFDFYGTSYTDVFVTPNGLMSFTDPGIVDPWGECLPDGVDNSISVMWSPMLTLLAGGDAYYQTFDVDGQQRLVVQWEASWAFNPPPFDDMMRVQAVLHSSGTIDVCYTDIVAESGGPGFQPETWEMAVTGIRHDAGVGIEFSCHSPELVDGLLIKYAPI